MSVIREDASKVHSCLAFLLPMVLYRAIGSRFGPEGARPKLINEKATRTIVLNKKTNRSRYEGLASRSVS